MQNGQDYSPRHDGTYGFLAAAGGRQELVARAAHRSQAGVETAAGYEQRRMARASFAERCALPQEAAALRFQQAETDNRGSSEEPAEVKVTGSVTTRSVDL